MANSQAPVKPVLVAPRGRPQSPLLIILVAWAVFTVLLVGGNLIANINWATPRLQHVMSELTNRHVTLGEIAWKINLNGLVVQTDMLHITELDGKPFMTAGPSEIGVDPEALMRGNIVIRHLGLRQAEAWAVEIEPGKWNFEDLFSIVENISSLKIEEGRLHIVQKSAFGTEQGKTVSGPVGLRIARRWIDRWKRAHVTTDVEDVYLELVRPQKDKEWPLKLSFTVPQPGYRTRVWTNVVGRGLLAEWAKNRYRFSVNAENVSARELEIFSKALTGVSGRLNMRLQGDGIFDKGMIVDVGLKTPGLVIPTEQYGTFVIDQTTSQVRFNIDPQQITWNDFRINTKNLRGSSKGSVKNWRTNNPVYNLTVSSRIDDLHQLAKILPAKMLPVGMLHGRRKPGERETLAQALYPARLTGRGNVSATIFNTGQVPRVASTIDISGVSTEALFSKGPLKQFSMLSMLSNKPIRLQASITTIPEKRAEIVSSRIFVDGSVINSTGHWDMQNDRSVINFEARGLNLATLDDEILRSDTIWQRIRRYIWLPSRNSFALSGKVDANGRVVTKGSNQSFLLISRLRDAGFRLKDGTLTTRHVNGVIRYDGQMTYFDKVTGELGPGKFAVSGRAQSTPGGSYNLNVSASHTDMAQARRLLEVVRVYEPMLKNMYGFVKEVDMTVHGTPNSPVVSMTAVPENIHLRFPHSNVRMRVLGGKIKYDNGPITFTNVIGTLGRGPFRMNGTISAKPYWYNLTIQASNQDIADTKSLLSAVHVSVPLLSGLRGTVKSANLSVVGSPDNPDIALVAYPRSVYSSLPNSNESVHISGGAVRLHDKTVFFDRTVGRMANSGFVMHGSVQLEPEVEYDLAINTQRADIADAVRLLKAFRIRAPLLTETRLLGSVSASAITLRGTAEAPVITLSATPLDIVAEFEDPSRNVRIHAGTIDYRNDVLTVRGMTISTRTSKLMLDATIANVSGVPEVRLLKVQSDGINLADADYYLRSPAIPGVVHDVYVDLLDRWQLADVRGRVFGDFIYKNDGRSQKSFEGYVSLVDAGAALALNDTTYQVTDLRGTLRSQGPEIVLEDVRGAVGSSVFQLSTRTVGFQSSDETWNGVFTGEMPADMAVALLPGSARAISGKVLSNRPLGLTTRFSVKPNSGEAQIDTAQISMGNYVLNIQGRYSWPPHGQPGQPEVDIALVSPLSIPAADFMSLIDPDRKFGNVIGNLKTDLALKGPLDRLIASGSIEFQNVSIPRFEISNISGLIKPEEMVISNFIDSDPPKPVTIVAKLDIKRATIRKLIARDIRGTMTLERPADSSDPSRVLLQDLVAYAADGRVVFDGSFTLFGRQNFDLLARAEGIDVNLLATHLLNLPNQIRGDLTADFSLCSSGYNARELLRNLHGDGQFCIKEGEVPELAKLQFKLTQANLLEQGLLGFNLNNLLASITPVKTSKFDEVSGRYWISRGIVHTNPLRYFGDDLRLWGSGKVDIPRDHIAMDMFGNVPRISRSVLGKFWGRIIGSFTLQNLLGGFLDGKDKKPRTFAFRVSAPLSDQEAIAKSIEESFHWLPNESRATPYPVLPEVQVSAQCPVPSLSPADETTSETPAETRAPSGATAPEEVPLPPTEAQTAPAEAKPADTGSVEIPASVPVAPPAPPAEAMQTEPAPRADLKELEKRVHRRRTVLRFIPFL